MYSVYILFSANYKKTYVGFSSHLEERLKEHNWGAQPYTRKYRPWVIIYSEIANDSVQARKREKYLKSAAGRRWMKKNLFEDSK